MMRSIETLPPFSLVFVMDPESGELPDELGPESVTAAPSSLAIGTQSDADGPTKPFLGTDAELLPRADLVVRWEGWIATSGRVGFVSAENQVLIDTPTPECLHLRVLTNDASGPDVVCVLLPSLNAHMAF